MDRQACTRDTVLVKRREKQARSETLPWWLRGRGKDDRKQNILTLLGAIDNTGREESFYSRAREGKHADRMQG
jgi:hypothetical protein